MAAATVLALAVSLIGGQTRLEAAAGGTFTSVSISPTTGTTATTFVFSATYSGSVGASSVRAVAGSITVLLARQAGTSKNGTWRATRTLPLGTRTFRFDALKQNNAIITSRNFGPVTVTAAPTPTPRPSPRPTPKPTPRPTTQPTTAPTNRPTATPGTTAGATPSGAGSGTPHGSASPPSTPTAIGGATETSASPSAGAIGSTSTDRNGSLLLAALLGVLVITGVGGIALLAGRRRAEEQPADGPSFTPTSASSSPAPVVDDEAAATFAARVAPPPPVAEPPSQPPGAWDAYADIDDRPLGTVDELPPGDYLRRPHGEG